MHFHNTYLQVSKIVFLLTALIFPVSMSAHEDLVSFSVSGGFYDRPFPVTLSCPEGYVIHYTTNGNTPKPSDPQYDSPLMLDERLYSHSNIFTIPTCDEGSWYVPETIKRCIVIRAAAFDTIGNQMGEVVTNSYFIKSLGIDSHGLPVISLCSDSLSLFDYETGIFVPGITGENYLQHGRDWERVCNFEFLETDNKGISQQAGLRIHGAGSRVGCQKGLKLYARKEYGGKHFNYKFFESNDLGAFRHLILKPAGIGLHRDHICSQIAEPLNFEVPSSRPVIVFINGEYWGLYFLKERPDDQFIADHYGYDKHEINVIESWTGEAANGSNENFIEMMRWFMRADLTSDVQYQKACDLIDIDCFIDYYCFQLFVCNEDWPDNNMRCWQVANGKWRWIFFDGDYCLTSFRNMLECTLYHQENKDISTLLFSKLLTNEDFREKLYARYGELLIYEFDPKNTQEHKNSCLASIEKEIDDHFNRFGFQYAKDDYAFQLKFTDIFCSIRNTSAAALMYGLFYHRGWTYRNSATPSQSTFKYNPKSRSPFFLFRMARQFDSWKFVRYFFAYERYRISEDMKNSSIGQRVKHSKIWKRLKGSRS